jgi:hypothetical protein
MLATVVSALKSVVRSAVATVGIRTEEQPPYTVVDRVAAVEIRRYGARLAAKIEIEAGDERRPANAAFRALARYFGGANRTKPARGAASGRHGSERLDMTAPVQMTRGGARTVMRFFMPKGYTRDTAPEPADRRVRVVAVPEETLAVLRFSGRMRASAFATQAETLAAALEGSSWIVSGDPAALIYDPPWTLPFLRRNEVAVPVAAAADGAAAASPS